LYKPLIRLRSPALEIFVHWTRVKALSGLISRVISPRLTHSKDANGSVVVPRELGSSLVIYALPIVGFGRDVFRRVRAVLAIIDPDKDLLPQEVLIRQLFSLTAAEARIALEIARGIDSEQIAATQGILASSVRKALKSIYQKTGVNRQAGLARLISQYPVYWNK
jgi:DNA-binding CsgD family transcriptional regulator